MTEYPPAADPDGEQPSWPQPTGRPSDQPAYSPPPASGPPQYQPPGYGPPGYGPPEYQPPPPYGPPPYQQLPYQPPPYQQQPYQPLPYQQQPYGPPPYQQQSPYQQQYEQPWHEVQPPYGQVPPAGWHPSGPGYVPPYEASGRRGLDGWSVAGLVCGILPTVVLGVAFSIVGLVRTGQRQRRGRLLAVVGLLLSVLWLVGFATLGALDDHQQKPTATQAEDVSPFDLEVGDCFQQPTLTGQISVTTVPRVSCAASHNAVMFATVQPVFGSYPGVSALLDEAVNLCRPKAISYLGRPPGRLHLAALVPHEAAWNLGLQTASCVLYDADHPFKGDIRKDR